MEQKRLNLLQATENSGPRNYGKNSSDHIQEKLNPYEENPITERNGDMSKLDLFFHNSVGCHMSKSVVSAMILSFHGHDSRVSKHPGRALKPQSLLDKTYG